MSNNHFRSPLTFKSEQFSRGYKAPEKFKFSTTAVSTFLKIMYVFLLMAIDLVLFTDSGNVDIFYQGYPLSSEIMIILGVLFLLSTIVLSVSVFYKWLQNVICALVTFWFVIALFNQFSQFDNNIFLGTFFAKYLGNMVPGFLFSNSYIILAVLLSGVVLWFLFHANLVALGVYVSLFLIALVGILKHDYCNSRNQHDFIELYQSQFKNTTDVHGQKFIYIMLPNLVSYKHFGTLQSPAASQTQQIMTGFFAKNDFDVFPNAYNKENHPFMNMASAVNTFSNNAPQEHIMDTIMLHKYWKFFNINDEYVFLKDNQMFDTFRKAGYKISAYKSRGFDLCHKKHMFNVDRCTEKLNHPVNLYSMNLTTSERSQLLLIEWLTSMKFLKNMSVIYQAMKIFSEPETLPLVGVDYNNLYVLNSIKTFDVLADNIAKDKGRQAYFVYADIPSDMFIYDEFCTIKPRNQWISKEDLPWVNVDNTERKRQAYYDQTKCLYGKLQEFISKLDKEKLLDKSVIVLSGMSGNNNFKQHPHQNFVDDMVYDKLVTLAIKSPTNTRLKIDNAICDTSGILRQYLYKAPKCNGLADINVHQSLKSELLSRLRLLNVTAQEISSNETVFDKWYQKWGTVNNITLQDKVDIVVKTPQEGKKHKIWPIHSHEKDTPDLKNETLQQKTGG